jgi:predicted enzyme related to lactoylglutathione lyase
VERVTGIGGVFFRARNPERLRAWYAENLGVAVEDWGGQAFVAADGDQTVWSIFSTRSDYFPRRQPAMLNYRVRDLDAMLAQLRAAGVPVEEKVDEDSNGRFAWATDPEGNRFELWEPRRSA